MPSDSRSPSTPWLLTVGATEGFTALVREAAQLAFGDAEAMSAESLAEALKVALPGEIGVLALLDPSPEHVADAEKALDAIQLPRWGVVVFTSATMAPSARVLAIADWNPRTLAVVLRGAANAHRLSRENARFRGDFLAIGTRVVHDLRSPLGGILTTAEVIKEILQDEVPASVSMTEPLIESTDGLTKIIRQLSTFTKATAGTNPKVRVNMSVPFWAAFQQVERQALDAGVTIRQPAKWPDVEGDPGWLQAIWHALLCNSIQHGGRPPRIEAGWTRLGGENRFWVIDGGEIPPAKRATLFTPFHLLHQPNAPRGLGLPIVRRLAELQGGRCGYELLPGEGFCFFFTLPVLEDDTAG
jgi:light-regulated signal transduction histidine kinase (bacteriophytochrome)